MIDAETWRQAQQIGSLNLRPTKHRVIASGKMVWFIEWRDGLGRLFFRVLTRYEDHYRMSEEERLDKKHYRDHKVTPRTKQLNPLYERAKRTPQCKQ